MTRTPVPPPSIPQCVAVQGVLILYLWDPVAGNDYLTLASRRLATGAPDPASSGLLPSIAEPCGSTGGNTPPFCRPRQAGSGGVSVRRRLSLARCAAAYPCLGAPPPIP